ncbi:terpenoid synthase [Dichomitus squalens]|uniref:Terpene synthase n=1 Tax=Dichomitus squalens TaxID=114155 RepID=A0A4Q9Q6D4_9APHY|nr:terpenoid synthase [Dichomitus squalens]TBU62982.1 terpenoid synthase [Dichomitus squalens]
MGLAPRSFVLPDLFSYCQYPLRTNVHCASVARASEDWLLKDANFTAKRQAAFRRLHAGELTAMCYPNADATRLRDVADFLNFLFTLDDWSDEFSDQDTVGLAGNVMGAFWDPVGFTTQKAAGKLAKSFSGRFRRTAGPGCTRRFIETMDLFFRAVAQQARDRARGDVPSLEEYIALRMDTSGCKPCFALIEYAAGIDLPDEVMAHPAIRALEEAANSHISWSNDIFSYDVEQARGDTHNMVEVVMHRHDFSLQAAVDYVGDLTNASIARFESIRRSLPCWGEKIDKDVTLYVQGLQDWMVGALQWSFDSARYFGNDGAAVKQHRVVILRPRMSATGRDQPNDALVHNRWAQFLMRCACIPTRVPRPGGSCPTSSPSHSFTRTWNDA